MVMPNRGLKQLYKTSGGGYRKGQRKCTISVPAEQKVTKKCLKLENGYHFSGEPPPVHATGQSGAVASANEKSTVTLNDVTTTDVTFDPINAPFSIQRRSCPIGLAAHDQIYYEHENVTFTAPITSTWTGSGSSSTTSLSLPSSSPMSGRHFSRRKTESGVFSADEDLPSIVTSYISNESLSLASTPPSSDHHLTRSDHHMITCDHLSMNETAQVQSLFQSNASAFKPVKTHQQQQNHIGVSVIKLASHSPSRQGSDSLLNGADASNVADLEPTMNNKDNHKCFSGRRRASTPNVEYIQERIARLISENEAVLQSPSITLSKLGATQVKHNSWQGASNNNNNKGSSTDDSETMKASKCETSSSAGCTMENQHNKQINFFAVNKPPVVSQNNTGLTKGTTTPVTTMTSFPKNRPNITMHNGRRFIKYNHYAEKRHSWPNTLNKTIIHNRTLSKVLQSKLSAIAASAAAAASMMSSSSSQSGSMVNSNGDNNNNKSNLLSVIVSSNSATSSDPGYPKPYWLTVNIPSNEKLSPVSVSKMQVTLNKINTRITHSSSLLHVKPCSMVMADGKRSEYESDKSLFVEKHDGSRENVVSTKDEKLSMTSFFTTNDILRHKIKKIDTKNKKDDAAAETTPLQPFFTTADRNLHKMRMTHSSYWVRLTTRTNVLSKQALLMYLNYGNNDSQVVDSNGASSSSAAAAGSSNSKNTGLTTKMVHQQATNLHNNQGTVTVNQHQIGVTRNDFQVQYVAPPLKQTALTNLHMTHTTNKWTTNQKFRPAGRNSCWWRQGSQADGSFVCERCGVRCKTVIELRKHIKVHLQLRPFSCVDCMLSYKTKTNFIKHLVSEAHKKKCLTNTQILEKEMNQTKNDPILKNNNKNNPLPAKQSIRPLNDDLTHDLRLQFQQFSFNELCECLRNTDRIRSGLNGQPGVSCSLNCRNDQLIQQNLAEPCQISVIKTIGDNTIDTESSNAAAALEPPALAPVPAPASASVDPPLLTKATTEPPLLATSDVIIERHVINERHQTSDHRATNDKNHVIGGGESSMFNQYQSTNQIIDSYRCEVCSKIFFKKALFRVHLEAHQRTSGKGSPFASRDQPPCSPMHTDSFLDVPNNADYNFTGQHVTSLASASSSFSSASNGARPYECTYCNVAFRIHGHLAKHLRSKTHITRLEALEKLPVGLFSRLEQTNEYFAEINTTDCQNSLKSLQVLAEYILPPSSCTAASITTTTTKAQTPVKPGQSEEPIAAERIHSSLDQPPPHLQCQLCPQELFTSMDELSQHSQLHQQQQQQQQQQNMLASLFYPDINNYASNIQSVMPSVVIDPGMNAVHGKQRNPPLLNQQCSLGAKINQQTQLTGGTNQLQAAILDQMLQNQLISNQMMQNQLAAGHHQLTENQLIAAGQFIQNHQLLTGQLAAAAVGASPTATLLDLANATMSPVVEQNLNHLELPLLNPPPVPTVPMLLQQPQPSAQLLAQPLCMPVPVPVPVPMMNLASNLNLAASIHQQQQNFATAATLNQQQQSSMPCIICRKIFDSPVLLQKHLMTDHAFVRPHICRYCDAGFTTGQALAAHMTQCMGAFK